jgi:uncharacterized membrane protein YkvA (DUF1232 family)
MSEYIDFEKQFEKLISFHEGEEEYELIKDYPQLFSLICNMSTDKNLTGFIKSMLNNAIAYFILPEDIISEKEHGIKGYIDDYFICIYVLRKFIDYDPDLADYIFKKFWPFEENKDKYLTEKYYSLMKKLKRKTMEEILNYSGVSFIEEEIKKGNNKSSKYFSEKINKLNKKIDYMMYLFLNNPRLNKQQKIEFEEQFFGTSEFTTFSKNMELLSKKNKDFERVKDNCNEIFSVHKVLKDARIKRLLSERD